MVDVRSAVDASYAGWGVPATYLAMGSAAQSITVIRYESPANDLLGPGNAKRSIEFEVRTSEIAVPKRGDLLIVAGEKFQVEQVAPHVDDQLRLLVERRA